MSKQLTMALLILLLPACGDQTTEAGPGGVSAEDARALEEAAEKLDTEAPTQPQ